MPAHRIHTAWRPRMRWYWFVANLYLDSAANLPWNELFILRCVFPVRERARLRGITCRKASLSYRVPVARVRVARRRHPPPSLSLSPPHWPPVKYRTEFYTPSLLRFSRLLFLPFFFLSLSLDVRGRIFPMEDENTLIGISNLLPYINRFRRRGCEKVFVLVLIVGISLTRNRSIIIDWVKLVARTWW